MKIESPYFSLEELVCPHIFKTYGLLAWSFLDPRLIETINKIREKIGKPIYVNSWDSKGPFDERGMRCIQCETVKKYILNNKIYVSAHMTGQGVDFDVQGLVAEEVRQWIVKNKILLPFPIRLEQNVSWVHLDVRGSWEEKVSYFNS